MDNETFGMIVVTIISLLFLFGIGSIVLSFFFDPKTLNIPQYKKDNRYYPKVTSPDYSDLLDDEEPAASVVFDPKDTFDTNIEDIE